jgi:HSP20 family protein
MAHQSIHIRQVLFFPQVGGYRETAVQPAADIYQTRRGWLVKFDLAGVAPEEVELTAKGSRLTVRGRRRDCAQEEGCVCHLMEIEYGVFERTLELPCQLDQAEIDAEFRFGMLLVRIQTESQP